MPDTVKRSTLLQSDPGDQAVFPEEGQALCRNSHCCVIELCGLGIMIQGESGRGKTSLALGLVDYFQARKMQAFLVADDQAILEVQKGRLTVRVPHPIAGKAELYGYGIAEYPYKPQTCIGLVVTLTPDSKIERMPESETVTLNGIDLPHLNLPARHEAHGIRIVAAWMKAHV